MKTSPQQTDEHSPLPKLYKAVAPAYLDNSGKFYRSEVRDESVRSVIFGARGKTQEKAESYAYEILNRCNSHHQLVADRVELVDALKSTLGHIELFDSSSPQGAYFRVVKMARTLLTRMEATPKQEQKAQ